MNNRAQSGTKILALSLAVAVGLVVLSPVVASINESTGTQAEVNESFSANFGEAQDLGGYNIDESTFTVNDTAGNSIDSSNFSLDADAGEVTVFQNASNGDGVSDGDTLEASYSYEATGGVTTTVIGFVPVMLGVLVMVAVSRRITEKM